MEVPGDQRRLRLLVLALLVLALRVLTPGGDVRAEAAGVPTGRLLVRDEPRQTVGADVEGDVAFRPAVHILRVDHDGQRAGRVLVLLRDVGGRRRQVGERVGDDDRDVVVLLLFLLLVLLGDDRLAGRVGEPEPDVTAEVLQRRQLLVEVLAAGRAPVDADRLALLRLDLLADRLDPAAGDELDGDVLVVPRVLDEREHLLGDVRPQLQVLLRPGAAGVVAEGQVGLSLLFLCLRGPLHPSQQQGQEQETGQGPTDLA